MGYPNRAIDSEFKSLIPNWVNVGIGAWWLLMATKKPLRVGRHLLPETGISVYGIRAENRYLSWNFTLPVCKPGFSGITGQWLNIAFNSCVSIGSVLYWLPMVAARRLVQYTNARKPIFTLAGTTIEVIPVHLANDLHPISVTFSPIGKVFSP